MIATFSTKYFSLPREPILPPYTDSTICMHTSKHVHTFPPQSVTCAGWPLFSNNSLCEKVTKCLSLSLFALQTLFTFVDMSVSYRQSDTLAKRASIELDRYIDWRILKGLNGTRGIQGGIADTVQILTLENYEIMIFKVGYARIHLGIWYKYQCQMECLQLNIKGTHILNRQGRKYCRQYH